MHGVQFEVNLLEESVGSAVYLNVYAAFCDFVTLCDGPDDDHFIGRNMLSM